MKKEDNFDAISNYLEKIYQLQTKVAKYNKPIVSIAPGHSFNSGATLLAASGHPLTTLHSQVAFNEVTFGFVPHSGATYYLSRLPGEFGTFLGLTGMSIHGSDAARIEISNGVYHNPMTAHEDMKTIMLAQSFPRVTSNLYFDKGPSSPRRHSSVY